MMKITTLVFVLTLVLSASGNALAISVFEDFEGAIPPALPPGSWSFSDVAGGPETAITTVGGGPTGNYLRFQGTDYNSNWYLGYWGNYKQLNWSGYPAFRVWIKGDSAGSYMSFELNEDDNANWTIEQDASNNNLFDDRFNYNLLVDWTGWQEKIVPFSSFVDANPGVGNNTWDPVINSDGSGGLLTINVIASSTQGGSVDWGVDELSAIPEPTSLLLLGSGLLGVFAFVRRKGHCEH